MTSMARVVETSCALLSSFLCMFSIIAGLWLLAALPIIAQAKSQNTTHASCLLLVQLNAQQADAKHRVVKSLKLPNALTTLQHGAGKDQIKIVHILSMGREASCFTMELVRGDTHACINEPSGHGIVEGEGIVEGSKTLAYRRLQCLYDCDKCTSRIINKASYNALVRYCAKVRKTRIMNQFKALLHSKEEVIPYMVLKTTRTVDHLDLMKAIPQQQLNSSRFIVLLRDPRGVWHSTKPWKEWAIHSIPLVCKLLALQALSLPELIAGVGKGRIMVAVYETWTMDVAAFSDNVAKFLQQGNESHELAKARQRPLADMVPPSWVAGLDVDETAKIESNPHCVAYMHRVGYMRGSHDYSKLKTSLNEFGADLTTSEAQVLSELRNERRVLLASRTHESTVEYSEAVKFAFQARANDV